jgi:hypothetical protein
MTSDREVMAFFFRAMNGGYAKGAKPEPVPDMPGFKQLTYKEPHFSLLDRWCSGYDPTKSAGTTTIWVRSSKDGVWEPAWIMHYSGWYYKSAIPTLKKALFANYSKRLFRGGRGPEIFRRGEHIYVNYLEREGFAQFSGREEIFGPHSGSLGYHEYSGQSLL